MTGGTAIASPVAVVAAAAAMDCSDNQSQEKQINDEYKIWKKNTPFLYDMVIANALEWPSLTVQWIPSEAGASDKVRKLMYGTHTNGEEGNFVYLATITLPDEDREVDVSEYVGSEEMGGLGLAEDVKMDTIVKIAHEGEVNRVQYMPSKPGIIATKCPNGQVLIFDSSAADSSPLRLTGHKKEGYGLAWNWGASHEGYVASGAEDTKVLFWDIEANVTAGVKNGAGASIEPLGQRCGHTSVVEDVEWHRQDPFILGSVGDDGCLFLWDIRQEAAVHQMKAHGGAEMNSICFSPHTDNLLATAGADKVVNLWDRRRMDSKMHSMQHHSGEVFRVDFSPFNANVLASGSADRRIMVWDIARIGNEQKAEDAADGPPELLFIHGGHTSRIADFSWHPQHEWLIASCADDNIMQMWQIADSILDSGDAEDTEDEKEKK